MLGQPELHTVLDVRPHQCSTEWDNHVPQTASNAVLDALQDTSGPFSCQGLQLAPVQLAINPDPQISFHGTAFQPLISHFIHIMRITLPQLENLAFPLVNFHMVGDCPALSSIQISL